MTTPIQKPIVELKKFQHAAFASQETNCYSAEVWVNGVPSFTAENDGHGGPDMYHPICNRNGINLIEAYVKTLPPEKSEHVKGLFPVTMEGFINDIIEDKLREKQIAKLKRKLVDRILIVDSKGVMFHSGKCDPSKMTPEGMAKWAKGATVVNLLTPDKQHQVFVQQVKGQPIKIS